MGAGRQHRGRWTRPPSEHHRDTWRQRPLIHRCAARRDKGASTSANGMVKGGGGINMIDRRTLSTMLMEVALATSIAISAITSVSTPSLAGETHYRYPYGQKIRLRHFQLNREWSLVASFSRANVIYHNIS